MDRGRRRRRGRSQYRQLSPSRSTSRSSRHSSCFYGGFQSIAFAAVVLCLAFMMMQYNCKNCQSKQELNKLACSVNEMAKDVHVIKNNYGLLEIKLAKYSQELPKLEGQVVALELLANALDTRGCGWNPRIHASLPFVDVHLNTLNKAIQNIPARNTTNTTRQNPRGCGENKKT